MLCQMFAWVAWNNLSWSVDNIAKDWLWIYCLMGFTDMKDRSFDYMNLDWQNQSNNYFIEQKLEMHWHIWIVNLKPKKKLNF